MTRTCKKKKDHVVNQQKRYHKVYKHRTQKKKKRGGGKWYAFIDYLLNIFRWVFGYNTVSTPSNESVPQTRITELPVYEIEQKQREVEDKEIKKIEETNEELKKNISDCRREIRKLDDQYKTQKTNQFKSIVTQSKRRRGGGSDPNPNFSHIKKKPPSTYHKYALKETKRLTAEKKECENEMKELTDKYNDVVSSNTRNHHKKMDSKNSDSSDSVVEIILNEI